MGKTRSKDLQESAPVDAASGKHDKKRAPAKKEKKEVPLGKLRQALGDKVLARTDDIAQSLIENTIKGNSNTARLVVSLVDKKPVTSADLKKLERAAQKKKKPKSVAIDLASDPQWRDPVTGEMRPLDPDDESERKSEPDTQLESGKESGDANEDR
jgi:hypothetical protein